MQRGLEIPTPLRIFTYKIKSYDNIKSSKPGEIGYQI